MDSARAMRSCDDAMIACDMRTCPVAEGRPRSGKPVAGQVVQTPDPRVLVGRGRLKYLRSRGFGPVIRVYLSFGLMRTVR